MINGTSIQHHALFETQQVNEKTINVDNIMKSIDIFMRSVDKIFEKKQGRNMKTIDKIIKSVDKNYEKITLKICRRY